MLNQEIEELEVPGNISIISKGETPCNPPYDPSLVHDVWQYDHDPHDQHIWEFINHKQQQLNKRHSQHLHPQHQHIHGYFLQHPYHYHSEVTRHHYRKGGQVGGSQPTEKQGEVGEVRVKGLGRERKQSWQKGRQDRRGWKDSEVRGKNKGMEMGMGRQYQEVMEDNHCYRDLEILERKSVSNINYLVSLTKELMLVSRMCVLEMEREQTKRMVMKLEIDCRKLRICLRSSSASVIRLHPINKKQYMVSPRNSKATESRPKPNEREKLLSQQITQQKHKVNQLNTKTSLLSNYYTVIKSKHPPDTDILHELSDTCDDTLGKKEKTLNKVYRLYGDSYENQKYVELLKSKVNVIRESIMETKEDFANKYSRKREEIGLLKKELELLNNRIGGVEDLIKQVKDANYCSGFRTKVQPSKQILFNASKSKRKLYYQNSPNREQYADKNNAQKSLSRIRNGNFLTLQSGRKKNRSSNQHKDSENNEYFLNVDSYNLK